MAKKISRIKKGTSDIAKLAMGVATGIAGAIVPGFGLLGTLTNFAIEQYIKRPERLLIDELRRGNIGILSDEKAATFIPMAYRFFEAAKEGEYEHNLRILAEFLKNEMKQEVPEPASFARMARRIEGLSLSELKVIAMINASSSTVTIASNDAPLQRERPFVSASRLADAPNNLEKFDRFFLQEALTELAARGLLIADGATRVGKPEEYYFTSSSFIELISKAENSVLRTQII
jgi:hypothetical protein